MLRLTLFLLVALAPVPTLAQPQAAGTIINIEGTTTVARATSPQPIVLSLEDAIFPNDRIETTITVLRGVVFAGSISSLSRASLGPNQSVTITGNVLGPVRMLERPAAWWMNEG